MPLECLWGRKRSKPLTEDPSGPSTTLASRGGPAGRFRALQTWACKTGFSPRCLARDRVPHGQWDSDGAGNTPALCTGRQREVSATLVRKDGHVGQCWISMFNHVGYLSWISTRIYRDISGYPNKISNIDIRYGHLRRLKMAKKNRSAQHWISQWISDTDI
jgi:hypothetical protein